MKMLLKPLQLLYWIYALALFLAIMLLIFPFVIIASFFGRIRGGNMILRLCSIWADCWFPLVFITTRRIHEVQHDTSKPYIYLCNHISYIDAAILVKALRHPFRALGKAELGRLPIFGFIYRKAIVTVDRSSAQSRARSVMLLKSILSKGISVLVFPEGTFNTSARPLKDFYDGAFRIAIETQTPIKPVLFLDAYRRLSNKSIFSLTPGISRILYLDEIPVTGYSLAEVQTLKEKVHGIMTRKMLEYDGAWRKS